jgi:periplasmic protein TonB
VTRESDGQIPNAEYVLRLMEDARRRRLLRAAYALLLSLGAHAVVLGLLVWLARIPTRRASAGAIRISLFAPGVAGVPLGRISAPEAARAPIHSVTARKNDVAKQPHRVKRIKPKRAIARRSVPEVRKPVQVRTAEHKSAATTSAGAGVAGKASYGARESSERNAGSLGTPAVLASSATHPPRILKRVLPQYPWQARVRGISGRVLLEVLLGPDGAIRHITVLRSVALLDDAAVRAVKQWRFSPARNAQGETVSVIVDIPVVFTLED